jgi:L-rhamnose mutarotase
MTRVDNDSIRRVGMVIGIKEDSIDHHRALHDGPGIRELLQSYKNFNYNIFLQEMPHGKFCEFAYYEYHGDDYESDMARLAKEPRNIVWLTQTDATRTPFEGGESGTVMQRIFFNP